MSALRSLRIAALALLSLVVAPSAWGTVLSSDSFDGATTVPALPASFAGANVLATTEPGEPLPCGSIHSTVWYSFRATAPAHVTANTFGSPIDTVLAVYWAVGPDFGSLLLLACNDDAVGLMSEVAFDVVEGELYYVQLGSYGLEGTNQGPFTLNLLSDNAQAPLLSEDWTYQSTLTCLEYNEDALTNACVYVGTETTSVPTATVTPGAGPCIIGPVCAPAVTPSSRDVDHPSPEGYVEVTVLCAPTQPDPACRATLP